MTTTESVIKKSNVNIEKAKHRAGCQPTTQLPDYLKPMTTTDYYILNDYH